MLTSKKKGYEYLRNEAIIRSKTREFFGVGTVVTASAYLVSVVDFMLIGVLLGADAVAAAGLCDSFVDVAELFGFVLSSGGPVAAGILLGKRRLRQANGVFTLSLLLTLAGGLLCWCLLPFCGFFSGVLSNNGAIANDVARYAFFTLLSSPFVGVNLVLSSFAILDDRSKLAMGSVVAANGVNIVLDVVFMKYLRMGVAGAAIATVLSQLASCVVGFSYMRRRYELLRFSARELRLDRTAAARVLQIGAPMALQQSIVSCGFLFLQKLVNLFGESMIASYTVASRMENILMIPIIGIQNTMATFAGQNMGARQPERVSRGLGQGVLVSLLLTAALCLCQLFGRRLIAGAFKLDEAAAAICDQHLLASALTMPIFAIYFPANGMFQGVGEGFFATFCALLALGLRVVFAYCLYQTTRFGYTAIWWSQAMAWTAALLTCYTHFFRGGWKKKNLVR